MAKIKLSKYVDDSGAFAEVGDAEFVRGKFLKQGDETLDFTGVLSISDEVVSVLLEGFSPSSLLERIEGAEGLVAEAIERWVDRHAAGPKPPAPKPVRPASAPSARKPSVPPPPRFEREVEKGERYTPSRLSTRLRAQLRSYIESAYPLSDPGLIAGRRELLETADGGRLIAQEPFVETTPRYPQSEKGYAELGLPQATGAFLDQLTRTPSDHEPKKTVLYRGLYEHQARALSAFLLEKQDLVVATGTGSGKTECFLVPMVASMFEEAKERPESFGERAVRALVLYPMNALVNDQVARLRQLLGSEKVASMFRGLHPGARHPLFGMYTSRTPYPGPRDRDRDADRVAPLLEALLGLDPDVKKELAQRGRLPAKDLEAFLARDEIVQKTYAKGSKKAGQPRFEYNWDRRLLTGPLDRELLTRQEMVRDPDTGQGNAPDVLVTNYSMLEYMLMRPFERPIFEQTRRWLERDDARFLLVLDEAHMYRGAKGAEVAFLIRRLLARLGLLDRPEKIRAILTSASLGEGDAEQIARRFAADLTGKAPERFEIVQGRRERPEIKAPGGPELASALAQIDLGELHGDASHARLRELVSPLLEQLREPAPPGDEPGLLRALHVALSKLPAVGLLLELTSGEALPLDQLAERVFPGHPEARKATEVLLSLGTMARTADNEPGLIPTRIHLMFRGFEGLYACLDPHCRHVGEGREERPQPSGMGRLYTRPRVACDGCGSRVYEVASCRECGTAYLKAYFPKGTATLDFLWGEVEGELDPVQVLPTPPRTAQLAEQALVQLSTGQLVGAEHQGREGVRAVWLPRDAETGKRLLEFARCPVCQPETSRRSPRINDLRTRGEQAFAALVDAQFAEQPPMEKHRDDLPNRGRKVLVFSDGRQRAARLAPAIETSHLADVFRQAMVIALRELDTAGRPPRVDLLYPAILYVCFKRGIELYPTVTDADGVERPDDTFRQQLELARHHRGLEPLIDLHAQAQLGPPASYARSLFDALTDRFLSVWAMGLATVEEDETIEFLFKSFPDVGLSPEEQRLFYRHWVEAQLERGCFYPPGASPEKLGPVHDRPEPIDPKQPRTLIPERLERFLDRLIGKEGREKVRAWLVANLKVVCEFQNDVYYLKPKYLALRLRLDEGWSRCDACGKLHFEALRGVCRECLAPVPEASAEVYLESKFGYYRDQVRRALGGKGLEPFGLVAAEHSAQLGGVGDGDVFSKTELHELRFQDVRIDALSPIDVLSCTTTMEVGIDIGSLAAVSLRNVPPHVANYQQRAGRAGRRGLVVASVLTYAHGGTHDAHYFRSPEKIVAGQVRTPVVYTENLRILRRHVSAYLVQRFFHEQVSSEGDTYRLFESMGTVANFLSEEHPCSYLRLRGWLLSSRATLERELQGWVPSFCHGFGREIDARPVIATAVEDLLDRIEKTLPIAAYARRDLLPPPEKEALDEVLESNLLEVLVGRAVFPRYAFPIDTVTFWVQSPSRKKGGAPGPRFDYQPQRDLQIALTEYAPGRTLTIDKWRFTSAALYSPFVGRVQALFDRKKSYTACKSCGYVSLDPQSRELGACPACGATALFQREFVRPDGFAPDVNAPREKDRGGSSPLHMPSTPARIEIQRVTDWDETREEGRLRVVVRERNLVTVNKGLGDRGFVVCAECGMAEPSVGPGFTRSKLTDKGVPKKHASPVAAGRDCNGQLLGPVYLGHEFRTDVILMRVGLTSPMQLFLGETPARSGHAARAALTSLVEATALSASRKLQIDEGELAGNWSPALGEDDRAADVYLYDVLPGGAGYARQVRENLDLVLDEAERLVEGCQCASSCYDCLRHYNNQINHASLDRHLARALLGWLRRGEVPTLRPGHARRALTPLAELLKLRGESVELDVKRDGVKVPMVVRVHGVETWVDVIHPLLAPDEARTEVQAAAMGAMTPCVLLDTYRLEHALPSAERQLFAHVGGH